MKTISWGTFQQEAPAALVQATQAEVKQSGIAPSVSVDVELLRSAASAFAPNSRERRFADACLAGTSTAFIGAKQMLVTQPRDNATSASIHGASVITSEAAAVVESDGLVFRPSARSLPYIGLSGVAEKLEDESAGTRAQLKKAPSGSTHLELTLPGRAEPYSFSDFVGNARSVAIAPDGQRWVIVCDRHFGFYERKADGTVELIRRKITGMWVDYVRFTSEGRLLVRDNSERRWPEDPTGRTFELDAWPAAPEASAQGFFAQLECFGLGIAELPELVCKKVDVPFPGPRLPSTRIRQGNLVAEVHETEHSVHISVPQIHTINLNEMWPPAHFYKPEAIGSKLDPKEDYSRMLREPSALAASPDGNNIAVLAKDLWGNLVMRLLRREPDTGDWQSFFIPVPLSTAHNVAFTPNGRILLDGAFDVVYELGIETGLPNAREQKPGPSGFKKMLGLFSPSPAPSAPTTHFPPARPWPRAAGTNAPGAAITAVPARSQMQVPHGKALTSTGGVLRFRHATQSMTALPIKSTARYQSARGGTEAMLLPFVDPDSFLRNHKGPTPRLEVTLPGRPKLTVDTYQLMGMTRSVSVSPDGRTIVVAGEDTLAFFTPDENDNYRLVLQRIDAPIERADFTPAGRLLVLTQDGATHELQSLPAAGKGETLLQQLQDIAVDTVRALDFSLTKPSRVPRDHRQRADRTTVDRAGLRATIEKSGVLKITAPQPTTVQLPIVAGGALAASADGKILAAVGVNESNRTELTILRYDTARSTWSSSSVFADKMRPQIFDVSFNAAGDLLVRDPRKDKLDVAFSDDGHLLFTDTRRGVYEAKIQTHISPRKA